MKRPTEISQLAYLQPYLQLSLPQFMREHLLLIVLYMFDRMKSYESGLITSRSTRIHGKLFAEVVSILPVEEISPAAEKRKKGYSGFRYCG